MILTLIASGPILRCLCVAPISAAPALDKGGFCPVRIQIQQITPIPTSGNQEADLRAEVVDSNSGDDTDAPVDGPQAQVDAPQGEITITTTPPEMTGSIPGTFFRGSRRAMSRISQISTKPIVPITIHVVAPKATIQPEPVVANPITNPPALAPESDHPLKSTSIEVQAPSDYPDISNPEWKSLNPVAAPVVAPVAAEVEEIGGMFKCPVTISTNLVDLLRAKYPQMKIDLGETTKALSLGKHRHQRELTTILMHGPPDVISRALETAQQWLQPREKS